jgi:hypothetical protein
VWNSGEVIPTEETRIARRDTCLIAPLFTINPTQSGLKLNLGFRGDEHTAGRLSDGTIDVT